MSSRKSLFAPRREPFESWISIADLMAGLMMVFMLLAIWRSEIANAIKVNPKQPIENISEGVGEKTEEEKEVKTGENEVEGEGGEIDDPDPIAKILRDKEKEIRDTLNSIFKDDFGHWGAYIPKETLTVRFGKKSLFFEQGESKLKEEGKQVLTYFFPLYVRILYESFKEDIREVRIEGHTSSEWNEYAPAGQDLEQFAFIKNMELSQARTRAAMEYVLNLPPISENKKYEKWVRKKVTANGLSSARLLNSNGGELQEDEIEDKNLSRRVEFSVQIDAQKILQRAQISKIFSNP